jgi:hypothetical protein
MNHSIYSVDRTTHLKIVAVALVAAIAVIGLVMASHVASNAASASTETLVKAGKPIVTSSSYLQFVQ